MSTPQLHFDVWPNLDAKGDPLGELTEAYGKQIRTEFNGLGNGTFVINRHDPQVAWCTQDNLVRVRLEEGGPFAWDDPRYRFAFWIEEGGDIPISSDEEAGEEYTRGGRGIMAFLERAIVHTTAYASGTSRPNPEQGYWRFLEGVHEGAVMHRMVKEARARWAAAGETFYAVEDFGDDHDSDGSTFDTFDDDYTIQIGTDLLSLAAALQDLDHQFGMDPDFAFHCWLDHSEDLTGAITFERGLNIREAADRQIHASPMKSRVLVRGTSKNDIIHYKEVVFSVTEGAIGRREGYTEYTKSAASGTLTKVGNQFLKNLKKQHDGPQTMGVTVGDLDGTESAGGHYLPWVDYREGSIVTLEIPGEYASVPVQVNAIVIDDADNGDAEVTLEFEATPFTPSSGPATSGSATNPSGGGSHPGGCDCPDHLPPFVQVCTDAAQFVQAFASANSGSTVFTFPNPVAVGHTVTIICGIDPQAALVPPDGWTSPSGRLTINFSLHIGGPFAMAAIHKVITLADQTDPVTNVIDPTKIFFSKAGNPASMWDNAAGTGVVCIEHTADPTTATPAMNSGAGTNPSVGSPAGNFGIVAFMTIGEPIIGATVAGYVEAGDFDNSGPEPWGGYSEGSAPAAGVTLGSATEWGAIAVGYTGSQSCTQPEAGDQIMDERAGVGDGTRVDWQANWPYFPQSILAGVALPDPDGGFMAVEPVVVIETDPATAQFRTAFPVPDGAELVILRYQVSGSTQTAAANPAASPTTTLLEPSDVVGDTTHFGIPAATGGSVAYRRGDAVTGTPSIDITDGSTTVDNYEHLVVEGGTVTDEGGLTAKITITPSVSALDDLSDVVISSPANADRLRYSTLDNLWHNSPLRWEPHVDYTGSVILDGAGNPVMVEVS